MTSVARILLLAAGLTGLTVTVGHGVAVAQPGRTPAANAPGAAGNPVRRQRVKERIRALRAYELTEQLGLDETSGGKVFPILAKYDEATEKALTERASLRAKLDALGDKGDDHTVSGITDAMIANQRVMWDLESKRFAELRGVLSAHQAARFLVVMPVLERKIQRRLEMAAARGAELPADDDLEDKPARPGPGRRGAGMPAKP